MVGWDVGWNPERPFALDMAGFAVNLQLLLSRPEAKFSFYVKRGHQETELLRDDDGLTISAKIIVVVRIIKLNTENFGYSDRGYSDNLLQ